MTSRVVAFSVGAREVEVMVRPMTTLQDVLRYQLGYTAAKEGCRQGGCGSCTVLVDGEPLMSCLVPAEDVAGQRVSTLEGLAESDRLDPLQQAFLDHGAYQCGYCSPGMIMLSKALLEHNPRPSRDEIVEALSGNVCRCTGYQPIVAALESLAQPGGPLAGSASEAQRQ